VERSLADQLGVLVEALGSDRQAAAFVGMSHTQLGAWRGGASPSRRSLTRIADGVAVVEALRAHGLRQAEIRAELYSLWPELTDRPAALVAAGKTRRILDVIPERFGDRQPALLDASPADLVAALRTLAAAAVASADALSRAAS